MSAASLLTGLTFLGLFNEWVIEFLFGQWKGADGKSTLGKLLIYIAAAVGIAEAFILKLNALPLVGVETNSVLGYVVTGIIVGAGSNIIHKFFGSPSRA